MSLAISIQASQVFDSSLTAHPHTMDLRFPSSTPIPSAQTPIPTRTPMVKHTPTLTSSPKQTPIPTVRLDMSRVCGPEGGSASSSLDILHNKDSLVQIIVARADQRFVKKGSEIMPLTIDLSSACQSPSIAQIHDLTLQDKRGRALAILKVSICFTPAPPPAWAERAGCSECGVVFSVLNARHHCRMCGRSLCATHSALNRTLPHLGMTSLVRVCAPCAGLVDAALGNTNAAQVIDAESKKSDERAASDIHTDSATNESKGRTRVTKSVNSKGSPVPPSSSVSTVQPSRLSSIPTQTRRTSENDSEANDTQMQQWEKDEDVLECRSCNKAFNLLRRKHHCRKCGKIFCEQCASTYTPLPEYDYNMMRVCEPCAVEATRDVVKAGAKAFGARICMLGCVICCYGYCPEACVGCLIGDQLVLHGAKKLSPLARYNFALGYVRSRAGGAVAPGDEQEKARPKPKAPESTKASV